MAGLMHRKSNSGKMNAHACTGGGDMKRFRYAPFLSWIALVALAMLAESAMASSRVALVNTIPDAPLRHRATPTGWEGLHRVHRHSTRLYLAPRDPLHRMLTERRSGRRQLPAGTIEAFGQRPTLEEAMATAIVNQAIVKRRPAVLATLLSAVAACSAPSSPVADDSSARDLTVEQTAIFSVQAPAPVAAPSPALSVVAWVDHADNIYAIGEAVTLFVRASKDAYLTVLNVGPSGNTTLLFPNAVHKDARVAAGRVVRIPAPDTGISIRVSGPVGRELVKVIATTSPAPLFEASKLAEAGPFATLEEDSGSVARDLRVTMDAAASHEWDDYNKVITTVANRPAAAEPLALAPPGFEWPSPATGLRIATDKSQYRMGETVSMYATSAVPCYLTLINIGSSGLGRVLLPNAVQPQNLLPAGRPVVLPAAESSLEVTPVGPPGLETVTAICSADNRPVVAGNLEYGRDGFASLRPMRGSASQDPAVAAAVSSRQVSLATVGFLVTR